MIPPAAHRAPCTTRSFALMASLSLTTAAFSGWSTDASLNSPIADLVGSQVTPKIASTRDGGCYIVWFDDARGGYEVRMQHLDASGNELWPHNGIVVSAHPQATSLVDWDLIADSAGNAVVVFCDIRDGGDPDVFAYRVGADGSQLWGDDGIQISQDADFEAGPTVCETTTGDFAVIWPQIPNAGSGSIRYQRIGADGTVHLAQNGVKVGGLANERPALPRVVAAADGDVIVSWVRNTATFSSPRHVHTQKVAPDGALLWNGGVQVVVFNASVPITHLPRLVSDGAGGAVYCWHRSAGVTFSSFVQRLDPSGAAMLTANGFEVSTEGEGVHKLDPAVAFDASTGDTWVAFAKRDAGQNNRGLALQRISAEGDRALGNHGQLLRAIDSVAEEFPRVHLVDGDAIVSWFEYPTFGSPDARILAARVDAAGAWAWGAQTVEVASTLSSKDDPVIAAGAEGSMLMCWSDERNDANDVYAQRVNADGSLGVIEAPDADLNQDGVVDGADLTQVLGAWGPCGGCPEDLNGDGLVDGAEITIILGAWTLP